MDREVTPANPNFEHECSGCFVRTNEVGQWVLVVMGSMATNEAGLIIKLCPTCAPVVAKAIDNQMRELIAASGHLPAQMKQ